MLDKLKMSKDFEYFLKEFMSESDRGSVIVAAVFLENTISHLIVSRLRPVSTAMEKKLFYNANAPLKEFSTKIDLAYLLGIIKKPVHQGFHLIRSIRNDFSHNIQTKNFEEESVQNRVRLFFRLNKPILDVFLQSILVSGNAMLLKFFLERLLPPPPRNQEDDPVDLETVIALFEAGLEESRPPEFPKQVAIEVNPIE